MLPAHQLKQWERRALANTTVLSKVAKRVDHLYRCQWVGRTLVGEIESQVFKGRVALYKAVGPATSGARDLSIAFLGLLWLEVVVVANLGTCRTS